MGLRREHSEETKEKISKSLKGRKLSDETKKRISKSMKGINSGKKNHFYGLLEEKNPNWKGDTCKLNHTLRHLTEHLERTWRKEVYKRDNYTCQKCYKRGVYLNAHHIKSWNEFPEDRFKISNGITLCRNCHRLEHKNVHN